jgi:hypothetical protein
MPQEFLIKLPFSLIVPEEIATTTVDFELDQYGPAEPMGLGNNVLVNVQFEKDLEDLYFSNELDFEYFRKIANDLTETLIHEDDKMVCTVSVGDHIDPTALLEFLTAHGATITPITS